MKVFVTRKIPQSGLDLLKKEFTLTVNPHDRVLTKEELIKGIKGKDGLLCLLTDPIDSDVINAEPNLKMIASYAVGYDNIDITAATKRGIPVSNTPGVLTETTAELAWALLFSVARCIVKGDTFTRKGSFKGWAPLLMLGQDVTNKTLGIIGTGRIGTAFALKSIGFHMKILYTDEQRNKELEQMLGAKKVPLSQLLKESDFASIHVPLSKATYHLIDERELRMMKKTAILINTARGPIINEKALIKALKEQWIFGAGLDVYEKEPEISKELKHLDNVVLQPHTGSGTIETRTKMALMAAENMIKGLKGQIPPNCVNTEVFQKKLTS
ncbi:MAG TPA: D-glycerate dehydrogenase [Thermoplasmata archaeon]|nr:MAG TPA: D-glycerate dehydrogenase [Thermoplasmata archaeon]